MESSQNLIGYCGLYCGACGIYQGRIRRAVETLQKVIRAYGFDKIMPELAKWEQSFQHYPEFEKVMNGLVNLFGSCPGCVGGGGNPNCAIRDCCKGKAYATCAACSEMETCEILKRFDSQTLANLRKIKALGVDKWAIEMQKNVNAGYCYLDETP